MTPLNTLIVEDRRLAMLALLSDSTGYRAGGPMLQLALGGMGHICALDSVDADLACLRDAGLVTLANVGGIWIATLSARGLDVAKGRTQVPGVARPRPE